ncbi:MAG TPA: glycoside hydrolase family 3 N-terminal domain-containing protein [Solirubrobacterales bacterium]|nr:glycoside hydrolase family 3 N-terminal domain-containing protein [Solirubrobacterales bacterium]
MIRRRRVAVGAIAALALIAGVAVGAGSDGDDAPSEGEPAAGPACPPEVAGAPRLLAGQKLIVRMEDEATPELVEAARDGEIAGVIVFPVAISEPQDLVPEIRRLQRAASRGGHPPLLVMIDQEGGAASRFPLHPPQRYPALLAESGSRRDSRLEGQATGNFLAEIGVGIDLAPVLDVPASPDSAMALRAFGDTPRRVERLGVAFAEGLGDEGTVAVPKHFPGLGRAEVSTDGAPVTIDASRRQLRGDLVPFRAAIEAGVEMIMISLAAYPAYGSDAPAVFSPEVVGDLLRTELGFEGVTITDDLEAPGATGTGVDEGEAAVAAAAAGVDLLLFALGGGDDARLALARAIRRGRLDQSALEQSCARLVELRGRAAEG